MNFIKITKIICITLISMISVDAQSQEYLVFHFDLFGEKDYENMVMRYKVKLYEISIHEIMQEDEVIFHDDTIAVEIDSTAEILPYNYSYYIDTTDLYISGVGMEIKLNNSDAPVFTYHDDPFLIHIEGQGLQQSLHERDTYGFTSHLNDIRAISEINLFASWLGKVRFERPVDMSSYKVVDRTRK